MEMMDVIEAHAIRPIFPSVSSVPSVCGKNSSSLLTAHCSLLTAHSPLLPPCPLWFYFCLGMKEKSCAFWRRFPFPMQESGFDDLKCRQNVAEVVSIACDDALEAPRERCDQDISHRALHDLKLSAFDLELMP